MSDLGKISRTSTAGGYRREWGQSKLILKLRSVVQSNYSFILKILLLNKDNNESKVGSEVD